MFTGMETTQSNGLPQPGGSNVLSQFLNQLDVQRSPEDTVYQYSYDPATQQYTSMKSGGIARAQAAGRHGDDRLVHMSSAELAALRSLARRHGRDLTINPETGLPEAFGIKDILPVAAAGALMFFGGPAGLAIGEGLGLSGALAQGVGMGLLSGGITTALTGDIKKGATTGLLSGLTAGAMYSPSGVPTPTSNVSTPVAGAQISPIGAPTAPTISGISGNFPTSFADGISQGPTISASSVAPVTPPPTTAGGFTPTKPSFFDVSGTPTVAQTVGSAGPSSPVDLGTSQPGMFAASNAPAPATGLGSKIADWWGELTPKEKLMTGGAGIMATSALAPKPKFTFASTKGNGNIRPYTYTRTQKEGAYPTGPTYGSNGLPILDTRERSYFDDYYTALPIYKAAVGGSVPPTGPVERMSQNIVGGGGMYPQSQMEHTYFATPTQMPASAEVIAADYDTKTNPFTGEPTANMAGGGLPPLGGYSDGGRLLKGPGDGVSDSIPATIAGKQPARLADGEFVIPARIVSELGNGSTDAGAKQLYAMMDRVQKARQKSAKKGKFAIDSKAGKYLPA